MSNAHRDDKTIGATRFRSCTVRFQLSTAIGNTILHRRCAITCSTGVDHVQYWGRVWGYHVRDVDDRPYDSAMLLYVAVAPYPSSVPHISYGAVPQHLGCCSTILDLSTAHHVCRCSTMP
eukprot:3166361-Rhodomonas_salina.3